MMLIMVLKLCMHCHLRVFKFKTCNTKVTITLTHCHCVRHRIDLMTLFQNVLDSFIPLQTTYYLYLQYVPVPFTTSVLSIELDIYRF